MAKLTLNDVANLLDTTTSKTTINTNSTAIETALENTLSRDGTLPNTMLSSLDMNSNQIINLPAPSSVTSPLRYQDLTNFSSGGGLLPVGGTTGQALTKSSNASFNVGWTTLVSGVTSPTSSLTLNNTLGAITAELNLNHANTWTGQQTFVSPILGTPASVTLTNATGLPLASITGFATGIATFLATPTSANLLSAVTDETGTGALVFGTSPTFTTKLTVPNVSATGVLTFTTNGTTFAGYADTASRWVLGPNNITPGTSVPLTVSRNTASAVSVPIQPIIHAISADTVQSAVVIDGFGTLSSPFISIRSGRGTGASFTATQSADALGFFSMVGTSAANTFSAINGTSGGGIFFGGRATENWSGTNQGCKLQLYTTANASNTIAETLTLQQPGATLSPGVAIPAGGTASFGYMFSSTANFGTFVGSGAPTLSAAQGSLYLRSDGTTTNNRAYINTNGSTTWTAITTVA